MPEQGDEEGGEDVREGEPVAVVRAATVLEPTELEQRARGFARDSRAASTWRAYDSDFADFRTWCAAQNPALESLPASPVTVALYLTALAETCRPAVRTAGHDRGYPVDYDGLILFARNRR